VRFIHCADLHLDSPLRGLERYEGAPVQEMREATRLAFINVVDLALEREADFVLIAGDVFDGDWLDFNTGLFFANQLRRLADAQIRAFVIRGNHDALSRISKSIPLPENTHVFQSKEPETVLDEHYGVAIHGQSFATGAVTEDLTAQYPAAVPGVLNIGLLHTALAGREGHEPYAPTTAERLAEKGYHYWALGHVHAREIVQKAPWIVFPGNTQGRHARELGPKGCFVVEGDPENGIDSVEFVATDVARWAHVEIDATGVTSMDELEAAIQGAARAAVEGADGRLLALRLSIGGRTSLSGQLTSQPENLRADVCAWLNEASGGNAWLEKLRLSVSVTLDLALLASRDDPFGWLLRRLDELAARPEELNRLATPALVDLDQKIPAELHDLDTAFMPLGAESLAQALGAARERLLSAIAPEDER
jgi:DNA repair exonuclease SbcCD nuclease subunit